MPVRGTNQAPGPRHDQVTRREVDPYHLWYAAGGLYLIGYCHRRRDVRMFAVEGIRSIAITDHPYQLPLGFDAEACVQDALVVMRGRQIAVELLFDRPTAVWARDRVWPPEPGAGAAPRRQAPHDPARGQHPGAGRLGPELRPGG